MTAARFLGRYELGERIGIGGVAEVMRATVSGARGFSKPVVVKRVREEFRENAEVLDAFVREAELARRFVHGNVVQVLDLGTDDAGVPFIVLEHVDGCSLHELVSTTPTLLPVDVAVHVTEQIGLALQYVHGLADDDGMPLGLVHRDVTPKNILLSRDGVVKLTDFGIARATRRGSDTLPGFVKGTPQYLSPEQAAGRPVDARTDVYALGLVLKQLLPDDADPELVAIADAATEPAMRDRLPSAAVFVARVQAWRIGGGIAVDPERLAALVRKTHGTANVHAIALDDALRDEPAAARTRQIAAQSPAPSRWRWIALGIAAVAITTTAAIAMRPSHDSEVHEPVTEVAPTRTASDETPPTPLAEPPTPSIEAALVPPPATPAPKRARKPVVAAGRLRVNVLPWAQVTIDGEDWGRTPIDRELVAGEHTIELYNPDSRQRVKKPVRIVAGKPSSIETW